MPSAFEEFVAEISNQGHKDPFENQGANPIEESQSSKTEAGTEGAPSSDDNQTGNEVPFHKNPRWQKMVEKTKGVERLESEVERLSGLVEKLTTQGFSSDDDTPAEWLAVHGDNENTRKAWKYQEKLIEQATERAKDQLRAELAREEADSQQEKAKWEGYIDEQLESLEDKYKVDLTSDTPVAKKARTEFLGLVQRLSPKDENGEVTSFADFDASWEYYQTKKGSAKDNNAFRKQELASRSMSRSSEAPTQEDGYTSGEGFSGIRARLGL